MQEEDEDEESEDEEDFSLFVKKFQKFVKKRRIAGVRISIIEENHKMILKKSKTKAKE